MNHKALIREGWDSFDSLKEEWNGLLRASEADTIFLTWEWIDAWRRTAGRGVVPFLVEIREEGGRLVGIAPYYRASFRLLSVLPYRALRVLGDVCTGAEYPDWIVEKGREGTAAAAIAGALADDRSWDVAWMPNMSGWNGSARRVEGSCASAGLHHRRREIPFAAFPLPPTLREYRDSLTRNRFRQLRNQENRLGRGTAFSFTTCTRPEDVDEFLSALFRLHHLRRSLEGDPGTFRRKPLQADFYRAFAPEALRSGWLRVYGLRTEGELRAVQYGYVYRNTYHQLQEGFDPAAPAGSGNVLRSFAIEALIEEGIGEYDFLGGMTEHKRRWGAGLRKGYDLFLGNRGAKCAALLASAVWPTGRYLRPASAPCGRGVEGVAKKAYARLRTGREVPSWS